MTCKIFFALALVFASASLAACADMKLGHVHDTTMDPGAKRP